MLVALAACGGKPAPAAPLPPPVCAGSFTITGQEDLAELGRCEAVAGDVTIRGAASLDFRAVEQLGVIQGELLIGPTFAVDTINLEGLREVGELRIVSNGLAGGVYLPKLERAGSIEIAANIAIAQISMSSLAAVDGELIVEQNPSLEILDLGALAAVGGTIQLRNNAILKMVEIRALRHAGGVDLTGSAVPEDHPLRGFAADSPLSIR